MQTAPIKTLIALVVLLAALAAQARTVTLSVNNQPVYGAVVRTNEVSIGTNEVAEVLSSTGPDQYAYLDIEKDGVKLPQTRPSSVVRTVIAGPANLRLWTDRPLGETVTVFCTVRIEPESFPPGQTIILPAGTVGVVHAQSSTNLVHWQDEWTHTFSNTNDHRFFRLSAERSAP